jgi:Fis family transcriptional regulator, factor for inversion stimulation protein
VGKLTLEALTRTQEAHLVKPDTTQPEQQQQPLRECLAQHLDAYFNELEGEVPGTLYKLVIAEIEPPLFEHVLRHTRGNVSRAAEMLGIHRSTLRRKLVSYGLI